MRLVLQERVLFRDHFIYLEVIKYLRRDNQIILINVISSHTKHSCCGGAGQGGRTLPRLRHGEVQGLADGALLLLRPRQVDGGVGHEGARGVEGIHRSSKRDCQEIPRPPPS